MVRKAPSLSHALYTNIRVLVERFFRGLTEKRLRRGVFARVPERVKAITEYIEKHNEVPKLFIWTAKASDILEKVVRANNHLNSKNNAAPHWQS